MGCGIHMYAETRTPPGPWCMATDEELLAAGFERDEFGGGIYVYNWQNYDLFAILADVRGPCGGKPIDDPRGMPRDASPEVDADNDMHSESNHNHSWFTVRELIEHDWAQGTRYTYTMPVGDFALWDGKGEPVDSWDDAEEDGVTVEPAEYESMIKHGMFIPGTRYFVRARWVETHQAMAGDFYTEVIPRLQNLGDPSYVRIVFWFDS